MVTRRLDTEERRSITSGCVFVWEERGPSPEATGVRFIDGCIPYHTLTQAQLGIERWTDGKRYDLLQVY
jgi:hypothetical protein